MARQYEMKYLSELKVATQSADEHPALQYLQHAIFCCATALSYKPKDPSLHFMLALLLEEKYVAEDVHGLKKAKVRIGRIYYKNVNF